jgi:6-phosphogluconate dehydrogenase
MSHDEMADTFDEWNKGELDSFLIEISANILKYRDSDGEPLVEKVPNSRVFTYFGRIVFGHIFSHLFI